MKNKWNAGLALIMASSLLAASLGGCAVPAGTPSAVSSAAASEPEASGQEGKKETAIAEGSRDIILVDYAAKTPSFTPQVAPYTVEKDLGNVKDVERFYLSKGEIEKLSEDLFVVRDNKYSEFFDVYEDNRYMQYPNFITTDSMMHTYHLYFSMLQKTVEKSRLTERIQSLTKAMLETSEKQLDALGGSEWEEAAQRNTDFFRVAASLMGGDDPDSDTGIVEDELDKIMAAEGISPSGITGTDEDYSQYKPRSYYAGDEELEEYFRTMMWYGRTNFAQKDSEMNRSALLMTLALEGDAREDWDAVYEITSFFAGQSDDLLAPEYKEAMEKAYGEDIQASDLIGDEDAFREFEELIAALRAPSINSVVFEDDKGRTDKPSEAKGFRFMGQRFTLDAAIFTQLCYSRVSEAPDGDKRMLPDGLDVPAALGSDTAREILIEEGNDKYPEYLTNMDSIRSNLSGLEGYWSSSLYAGWMYALNPLLEEKKDGYPSFMTNKEWQKKSLEGYLGSWTELKHDTVLYSKQFMAEMGGGDEEVFDDRGYVEPEPELYGRLSALIQATIDGLSGFEALSKKEKESLEKLLELSESLKEISILELENKPLSDEQYELIRGFGGSLEHFWEEAVLSQSKGEGSESAEFPAALVTDVATDPNGFCLLEGIGGVSKLYVVFPLDGELHLGIGGVYNYYQFMNPISERLTDQEWRQMLGMAPDENMEFHPDDGLEQPEWVKSYRYYWSWESNEE
ncbi:MAG: DUF3160 domain-containing protein [Lachnospiraceae bacterium]|nr:DUF3160 domain-containing protein [Lachnospiraceae bacterium]